MRHSWKLALAALLAAAALTGPADAGSPARTPTPRETPDQDPRVMLNVKSLKYHCAQCDFAKRCTKSCVSVPLSEAVQGGGSPCKSCNGRCP